MDETRHAIHVVSVLPDQVLHARSIIFLLPAQSDLHSAVRRSWDAGREFIFSTLRTRARVYVCVCVRNNIPCVRFV